MNFCVGVGLISLYTNSKSIASTADQDKRELLQLLLTHKHRKIEIAGRMSQLGQQHRQFAAMLCAMVDDVQQQMPERPCVRPKLPALVCQLCALCHLIYDMLRRA